MQRAEYNPARSSLPLYVTCGVVPRTFLLFRFVECAGYNQPFSSEGDYGRTQ
jgi:hypothetical protein